jgi:hypothetical protein
VHSFLAKLTTTARRRYDSMSGDDDSSNIAMLMSMGFGRDQSALSLKKSGGNVERAIDSLLSGGAGVANAVGNANDNNVITDCIHCEISQYSDASQGRSACTAIALVMASKLLNAIMTTNSNYPEGLIDSEFLSSSIKDGIALHTALVGNRKSDDGVEHTSVEEILHLCENDNSSSSNNSGDGTFKQMISMLEQTDEPQQGILSSKSDHPFGLEAILYSCQDKDSFIAVVITKPPETVLCLLPPHFTSPTYILLDSHPRTNLLSPHYPSGSYALIHSTLSDLVASLKQIFPVTELGDDVAEMFTMMYNSFDVYQFKCKSS